MSAWRAFVREEWALERARLLVVQDRGADVDMLMQNGTWRTVPQGTTTDEAGLVIPTDAVGAVLDALKAFVGERGPTEGEVRVLREWLAHERGRVDALVFPTRAAT